MLKTKSISLIKYNSKSLALTTGFIILSIAAPLIFAHTPNNQWIVGPIVNALLFLATLKIGITNAIIVGVAPSAIALLRGLLPAPIAIMIPFIIIANSILIISFGLLKTNYWIRMITASFLKFSFLYFIVSYIIQIPGPIAQMMQLPQLITSLAGGFIAFGIISGMEKIKNKT